MPITPIIDVATGLSLVFLLLSTLSSGVYEFIAGLLSKRAKDLAAAIRNMIGDQALVDKFFAHATITSLSTPALRRNGHGKPLPSYIPSDLFSKVLLDLLPAGAEPGAPRTVAALRAAVAGSALSAHAKQVVLLHLDQAQGDLARATRSLEQWFDHSMDRLSSLYKRQAQTWLLLIALVVTVAFNVDTLKVATALWRDPTLRASLVAAAEVRAKQEVSADSSVSLVQLRRAKSEIRELRLPIFWPIDESDEPASTFQRWTARILGYLVTVAAITFGAPFWFDALNKLVNLRSGGRAPVAKSGDAPAKTP